MKRFLLDHKKAVVGFGIYYTLFAAAVLYGLSKGWNLRIPVLALALILIFVTTGGDEGHAMAFKTPRRDPMATEDLGGPIRDMEGFEFPTVVLLVLPQAVFLLWDLLL